MSVLAAFEPQSREIALADILPSKPLPEGLAASVKYQQVRSSILEIGMVEPPAVVRIDGKSGKWLLLDGHVRVQIWRSLNHTSVVCLIALKDEAFTYNKRINRIGSLQEHKMILNAVQRGVSADRLAKALNVNVKTIQQKYRLLDGICPETEALLADRMCPINTFEALKKMLPIRQIEAVEMMIAADNFSIAYARALLASTSADQRIDGHQVKAKKKPSREQLSRLEHEVTTLQREAKAVEQSYASDQLNLVLARAYIASLMRNDKVADFLERHYPDVAAELEVFGTQNRTTP